MITLAQFQQYCSDKCGGVSSLEALYAMVGSRQEAIQMYMESGFDAPMMDWLADNGMSEIVFRRMQIESNKQILALLQDIKELLVSINRESPPRP